MGCIVSLFRKIFIFALIVAFFALGGWAFVKGKINDYKNPPRNVFIEEERDFGDFSFVSSDYQLTRSFRLFGYAKITAKYLPTETKINIFNLKDETKVSVEDFKTGEIDKKIDGILNELKGAFITFENFKIISKGNFEAKNKKIPYLVFQADVKNIPFKEVVGVLAVYNNNDSKTRIIVSLVDKKAYNPVIVKDFVSSLRF